MAEKIQNQTEENNTDKDKLKNLEKKETSEVHKAELFKLPKKKIKLDKEDEELSEYEPEDVDDISIDDDGIFFYFPLKIFRFILLL
jgi:hypothetical protein